jgi:hypothetical protein
MATEAIVNGQVLTTLAGAIGETDTTLTVSSASGFPPADTFRIRLDDELLLVTAGAGTTAWTVTRGVEGSHARNHAAGATVLFTVTEAGLSNYLGLTTRAMYGTVAARPATALDGARYFHSDAPYDALYTGGAWQFYGPRQRFKPLPISSGAPAGFTQIGSTTGVTVSTANGKVTVKCPPAATVVDSWRCFVKTLPSLPFSVTACMHSDGYPADYWTIGLILRDSVGGKLINYGMNYRAANPGCTVESVRWTNLTTFNSLLDATRFIHTIPFRVTWFRLRVTSTTITCEWSPDGISFWRQWHTEALTAFLPAVDQVGFGVTSANTSQYASVSVLSWEEGT